MVGPAVSLLANIRCLENSWLPSRLSIISRPARMLNPYLGSLSTEPIGSDGGIVKVNGFKKRHL